MSRFFDESILSDDQIEENCCQNGSVSPQARYNDYRNRMPFHYIEDDESDGYYYWRFGATINLEIEIEDDIAFTSENENYYIKISEYFENSENKYLKFVLTDFRGNPIDIQKVKASSLIIKDGKVYATYRVSERLSSIMVPNQYKLFIYIIEVSQNEPDDSESVIFNKCLTETGIQIKVFG